jgi:hypothetical protein
MKPDLPAEDGVVLKTVALPIEHGGWGFLLEPVVLGLVLAPSWAGLALGGSALAAFLARHPLKLALGDHRRGARHPRTGWAEAFALGYAFAALACFGLALATTRAPFWLPLVAAAPLAATQLWLDARHRGRDLTAELAGAIALGASVSMIVLAQGWPRGPALALWAIMAARAAVSVLYIRTRLRLDRGLASHAAATWTLHLAALAVAAALAAAGWAPWLALVAFTALLARAAQGLSSSRRRVRPRVIGFRELGFGILTVLLVAAGYAWRL